MTMYLLGFIKHQYNWFSTTCYQHPPPVFSFFPSFAALSVHFLICLFVWLCLMCFSAGGACDTGNCLSNPADGNGILCTLPSGFNTGKTTPSACTPCCGENTTVRHGNYSVCACDCSYNKLGAFHSHFKGALGLDCFFVLCVFSLLQDCCLVCGGHGQEEEGVMLCCVQCGQCYHPFCVNAKVS